MPPLSLCLLLFLLLCTTTTTAVVVGSITTASSISERRRENRVIQNEFISKTMALMKQYMNPDIDPCENMYEYACGNFGNVHEIPADEMWITRFYELEKKAFRVLRKILVTSKNNETEDTHNASPTTKLKRFYNSCMDRKLLERRGVKPLLNTFKLLGGWPVLEESSWNESNFRLEDILADLTILGYKLPLQVAVDVDPGNPKIYSLQINTGRTGSVSLLNFKESVFKYHMRAYENYVVNVLKMFGVKSAYARDTAKELALIELLVLVEQDTAKPVYKRTTVGNLPEIFFNFNYTYFLGKILNTTVSEDQEIIVIDTVSIERVLGIFQVFDARAKANWLLWRVFQEDVNFLGGTINVKAVKPLDKVLKKSRRKFCQELSVKMFKKLLGAKFVKHAFKKKVKADVQHILEDIQASFRELVEEKEWLQQPTKHLAVQKVLSINFTIGYDKEAYAPERILRESADYIIYSDKFYENVQNVRKVLGERAKRRLGKGVDYLEQRYPPFVVNAGYGLNENHVQITTAFLQSPLYHRRHPKAMNYGSMGTIIGHETGHALDNLGRKFDRAGYLKDWWDENSKSAFFERALCFENQYNRYTFKNESIDGYRTLGENLSDNTGLRQAYRGYTKWLERNEHRKAFRKERLPGLNLSPEQIFFLAFAQTWCVNVRPEHINEVLSDKHAPGPNRVNGPLSNFIEFSAAFGCEYGSGMNPLRKCHVW